MHLVKRQRSKITSRKRSRIAAQIKHLTFLTFTERTGAVETNGTANEIFRFIPGDDFHREMRRAVLPVVFTICDRFDPHRRRERTAPFLIVLKILQDITHNRSRRVADPRVRDRLPWEERIGKADDAPYYIDAFMTPRRCLWNGVCPHGVVCVCQLVVVGVFALMIQLYVQCIGGPVRPGARVGRQRA